jgi:hypothetical protein
MVFQASIKEQEQETTRRKDCKTFSSYYFLDFIWYHPTLHLHIIRSYFEKYYNYQDGKSKEDYRQNRLGTGRQRNEENYKYAEAVGDFCTVYHYLNIWLFIC